MRLEFSREIGCWISRVLGVGSLNHCKTGVPARSPSRQRARSPAPHLTPNRWPPNRHFHGLTWFNFGFPARLRLWFYGWSPLSAPPRRACGLARLLSGHIPIGASSHLARALQSVATAASCSCSCSKRGEINGAGFGASASFRLRRRPPVFAEECGSARTGALPRNISSFCELMRLSRSFRSSKTE